jgi:hypothetical protein
MTPWPSCATKRGYTTSETRVVAAVIVSAVCVLRARVRNR